MVRDVDGDGLRDLTYLAPRSSQGWRVRFQARGGALGPERSLRFPTPRKQLTPVRLRGWPAATFASVQARTGLMELTSLEGQDRGAVRDSLSPRVYSTPTRDNLATTYAVGEFDGDGRQDLAVADRKGSQVWLYLQRADGVFAEPTAFPSYSDLRSIAAGNLDGDGADELYVVSGREAAL